MENPEFLTKPSQGIHNNGEILQSPDEIKYVDKDLKKLVEELHDQYQPEAIFMTQTSATLLGWSAKEAWKKAWPDEKVPAVFTINTREIQDKYQDKKLSKGDPGYEILEEVENKKHEERLEEIEYLKKVIEESVYDDSQQKRKENAKETLKHFEEMEKNFAEKNFSVVYGEDMLVPTGFSLQLSNENWPEFVRLKQSIIDKLKPHGIKGNIAIIDENAGYREKDRSTLSFDRSKRKNVYEPEEGEIYDRNSQTLGIAKQALDAAIKEMGLELKVVVAGYDPGGDTAGRKSGGPWKRYSKDGKRLPNGQYRRVQTHTEEGKIAKEKIEEFKEIGRYAGEELKKELEKQ